MKKQTLFELITNITIHLDEINHHHLSTEELIEGLEYLLNIYWSDDVKNINNFIENNKYEIEHCEELQVFVEDLKRHAQGDFTRNKNLI